MKKMFALGMAGLAVLAFAIAPAQACDGAKSASNTATKTDGKLVGSGSSCGSKETGAKMTAAECAKACASKGTMTAQMSPEECAKMCGYNGTSAMANMSIKGMTCGGCETSVKSALEKVPGVIKVVSIDHKAGSALVCYDPAKVKTELLTTTVSNKGFAAEIIPAVATSGTPAQGKVCSPEAKAACEAKAKGASGTTTTGSGTN